MNRRIWGIIIVILALAIIAGIIYIIFFYKFSAPTEPIAEQPAVEQTEQPKTQEPVKQPIATPMVSPLKKAEVKADDLSRMGAAFAERYGSYSNQSDYGNIRDLQIFMTTKMKNWSDSYITDARSRKGDPAIYYGIVTKAISSEVKRFDSDTGQAEILVKTQRRESAGVGSNSAVFYQDITIKYLKQSGIWRVDEALWQTR